MELKRWTAVWIWLNRDDASAAGQKYFCFLTQVCSDVEAQRIWLQQLRVELDFLTPLISNITIQKPIRSSRGGEEPRFHQSRLCFVTNGKRHLLTCSVIHI
jgi:hypothetical protein